MRDLVDMFEHNRTGVWMDEDDLPPSSVGQLGFEYDEDAVLDFEGLVTVVDEDGATIQEF